jgi:hypothetical protein
VLNHPIGCCLAKSLSILIDDRLLVIVCLRVVDEPFAVALDLGERCILAVVEFTLSHVISMVIQTSGDVVTAAATVRLELVR